MMREIELPNGDVIELTGNESPEQLSALRQKLEQISQGQNANKMTIPEKLMQARRMIGQGASFGFNDEIDAAMGALVELPFTEGEDYGTIYNRRLENERAAMERGKEEMPVVSGLLEAGSGILGGLGAAKGIMQGAKTVAPNLLQKGAEVAGKNILTKGATASGIGAGSGAAYGFGAGSGGFEERAAQGAESGKFGAAFGLAGAGIAPAVGGLAARVARTKSGQKVAQKADDIVQKLGMVKQQQSVIPMTKGQLSQSLGDLQLEDMARKNTLGDEAYQILKNFDERQQDEILGFVDTIAQGGDEITELNKAAEPVKKAYKDIKAKISQAYDDAKIIDQTYIYKKPLSETLVPRIKQEAKDFGASSIQDLDAPLQKVYRDLTSGALVKDPKLTSLKLSVLEDTRKRLNNIISQNSDKFGDVKPSGVFALRMKKALDDTLDQMPKEAFKAGDADALEKILKARKLRAEKGRLFDSNKIISDIVKNDELNNEQLANIVLAGSKGGKSIGTNTVNVIRAMKSAAGENAPNVNDAIKKGLFANILRKSYGTVLRDNVNQVRAEPFKLRNELKKLTENKSLMNEIFSADEQAFIKQGLEDLTRIASIPKGGENYSNSAMFLKKYSDMIPGVRQLMSAPLEAISNATAAQSVELATKQFADELQRALAGNKRLYGAAASGVPSGMAAEPFYDMQQDIDKARTQFYNEEPQ